jgi:ribosomal-protein-alanine acetyltransferase
VIRPATAADADAVAALETALFGADAWTADTVVAELTGEGRRAEVAVEGRVLAGYAVCLLAGDTADLARVAVEPGHRRTGLATALIARLSSQAVRDGARRMLLEVATGNEAARALYASAGFAEVARRRRYYRDGSDALVLERALTADVLRGPEAVS